MKTRFSVQCSEHKPSNCVVANFKTNGLSLIHYSTLLWLRGGTSKWGVDIGRTEKSFFLVQKHYFRFRSLPSHLEGWDWVGEKTRSLCCWCCFSVGLVLKYWKQNFGLQGVLAWSVFWDLKKYSIQGLWDSTRYANFTHLKPSWS